MKISYHWLCQFINTSISPQDISLILTNIGLEVEHLEEVQSIPGGLEGLLVGHVKTVQQHPNADRLRITTVDIGAENDLQIVCGAPNVAAGQKVVVAPVGCTVHPTSNEPFKINKSKIRGEVSEGMICGEDEVGLGTSHEGIMELSADAKIGIWAKDYFNISSDYVFEIGLTPNRADAASHLGVARDLAAYLKISFQLPNIDAFAVDNHDLQIPITVQDTDKCPRYAGLTISGLTVAESPDWLKAKLSAIGLRPINNVVDCTNYILHDLGQPLHAFDADKITGRQVQVRTVNEGSIFKTLDGVERKLSAQDLVIANEAGPMCLAGVFGGEDSGVSATTQNIFLESAYFDAVSVRKSAKYHGLKTDASFRFERGTDPNMVVFALKRAALLIKEVAGGHISSEIQDIYPQPVADFAVEVSFSYIQKLIGKNIPETEIKAILTALNIKIESEDKGVMQLKVPAYKVDVTRACDITEEVLRIYGYDNIEIPAKINASLSTTEKPDKETVQHLIADLLTANGYHEIWCNSLTKSGYSTELEEAVKILNPLSRDLDVMRQSLLFPALEVLSYNQKRKSSDLKLYEFGKTYHLIHGKYTERERLLLLITGNFEAEQWNQKPQSLSFYHLKSAVDALVAKLNIGNFETASLEKDPVFEYGLKYFRGDKVWASFGAVATPHLKKTEVEKTVFAADIDFAAILQMIKKNKIINKEIPKYPAVRRDLSILIEKEVPFGDLKTWAFKTDKKLLKEVQIFDVYQGDKLPAHKKSYALSFVLQDEQQTLSDKQIDSVMQKIALSFEKELGAEIRKN